MSKNAFTLLELLVVIAIIGILIALLLPAVQAARESARRFQCTNNLMQLGVAVKHYESNRGVLPAGTVNETGPIRNVPVGNHLGWIPRILPYIEQTPLYEKIDFSKGCYDPENREVWFAPIFPTLACPSDANSYRYSTRDGLAQSSYMACHGGEETSINLDNNGVFSLNSKIRSRDIFDGTSNTVFLGESVIFNEPNQRHSWYATSITYILPEEKEIADGNNESEESKKTDVESMATSDREYIPSKYVYGGLGWASGTPGTIRNTGNPVNTLVGPFCNWEMPSATHNNDSSDEERDDFVNDEVAAEKSEDETEYKTRYESIEIKASDSIISAIIPTPKIYEKELPGQFLVGGYSSYHTGGANHLMGDGSIRFITPNTALSVYQKMGSRDDNRPNKIHE
ncbi:MAG: DUF1559 domain-containing protein [Planctomycetaceae bacterium]|nr:DUF1559 domain-containing protein [Planctomycetaceae bacterium]